MEPKLLTADRFVDMRMGCSYRYVHSSTEYFRPHYHDYYEIFIPTDGSAVHMVNGENIPLKRGQAVFIRPSDTHDYICENGTTFSMLNITFTAQTVDEIFAFLGEGFKKDALLSPRLPPAVTLDENDFSKLTARMSAITALGNDNTEKLKTSLRILIFHLITEHFAGYREKSDSAVPAWLSELRREMKKPQNFTKGSAAIVELCGKSREHVSRCMKKYYGVTVSEFINGLRLNFVANMLIHSNHNILDIVLDSGFNSTTWASKCFAQKYGCTMSEYRKRPQ